MRVGRGHLGGSVRSALSSSHDPRVPGLGSLLCEDSASPSALILSLSLKKMNEIIKNKELGKYSFQILRVYGSLGLSIITYYITCSGKVGIKFMIHHILQCQGQKPNPSTNMKANEQILTDAQCVQKK